MIQMLFDEYEINIESLAADAEEHEEEPSKPSGKTIDKEKKQEEEPPVEEKGASSIQRTQIGEIRPGPDQPCQTGQIGSDHWQTGGNKKHRPDPDPAVTEQTPCCWVIRASCKTAVVEGLALYAVSEDAVDSLRKLHIVEITMSAIVAGTKYRGEFESKIQEVINIARAEENLVLFIDELHTLLGAGAGEGALDASNILKPALGRGDISCIGASTTAEFRKFIEPDGALTRRFQVVWIDEPAFSETVAILKGLKPKLEEHHAIRIDNKLLDQVVSLTSRSSRMATNRTRRSWFWMKPVPAASC